MRGASKNVEDIMGRKPIDLISEIRSETYQRDVRRILSPSGALDCLMLNTPTKLVRKKATNLAVFIFLFIGVVLIEIFITLPFLAIWQIVINAISTMICSIFLLLSVMIDPGYISKDKIDFLHLLEVVECT